MALKLNLELDKEKTHTHREREREREKPEEGALGRVKKPQEARDARELRWVCDGSMKRAIPSPYSIRARLGLSAIFLCFLLCVKKQQLKIDRERHDHFGNIGGFIREDSALLKCFTVHSKIHGHDTC